MSSSDSTDQESQIDSKNNIVVLTSTISDDDMHANTRAKLDETSDTVTIVKEDKEDIRDLLLKTFGDPYHKDKAVDFSPQGTVSNQQPSIMQSRKLIETDDEANFDDFEQRLQASIPGRYDVLNPLGKGGFGQVFSVRDNNLKRNIAVKFMHPNSKETRIQQFIQEARTTAKLSHPNILPVYDLDYTDGAMPYFTMRKASGLDLEVCINTKHPSINTFLKRTNIIIKICDAIAYTHNKDVIHNDIKPSNIIVGELGDIMLADWGTCTFNDDQQNVSGKLRGTPMYMSPEQARLEKSEQTSDIYALGCTLFHLLTLRFPYISTDNLDTFWVAKKTGAYDRPSPQERSSIPPQLLAIAEKAMQTKPEDRYLSVREMRSDLQNFRNGEPVSCYKDSILKQLHRLVAKNKAVMGSLCASLILIIFGAYQLYLEVSKESSDWSLTHSESFNISQSKLSDNWSSIIIDENNPQSTQTQSLQNRKSAAWYVLDSALYSNPQSEDRIFNLASKLTTTENSKVTWTVSSVDKNYNFNAYIGGDTRLNAYSFHIGHRNNSKLVTLHKGNEPATLASILLPQHFVIGKSYTFTMKKSYERITLELDGARIIDYTDPLPLNGGVYTFFGFECRDNIIKIDNVSIWCQPLAEKINPITIADNFYNRGNFALAFETYNDIRINYPSSEMAPQALHRSALCLQKTNNQSQAKALFHQFVNKYPLHHYTPHAYSQLALNAIHNNDTESLKKYLDLLSKKYPGHQVLNTLFSAACENITRAKNREQINAMDPFAKKHAQETIYEICALAESLAISPATNRIQEALQPYTDILLQLGEYDELRSLSPQSSAAITSLRLQGNIARLKASHPDAGEYAQALVQIDDFIELYSHFGGRPDIIRSVLSNTDKRALFTDIVPIDSPLQRHLLTINQSPQTQVSPAHATPTPAFLHAQKQCLQSINLFSTGEHSKGLDLLLALRAQQHDYQQHSLSSFILIEFMQWTTDRDLNAFTQHIQKHLDALGNRYGEFPKVQLQYVIGSITANELHAHPSLSLLSSSEKEIIALLHGIRLEISGDTAAAIVSYKNENITWTHPEHQLFATWRISELSK